MQPLTADQAHEIWSVLERMGAVEPSCCQHDLFVLTESKRFVSEYRFVGNLGMGGKFWRNNSKWYVTCYNEDQSPARFAIMKETNRALTELKEKLEPHG